jgi:glutathione reductase (NADPH)
MLHALADVQQHSMFKAVCVGEEQRVVGLHLVGEAADEILQGFAVAVRMGATLADFHATVAIHPTSAEEIVLLR